MNTYSDGWFVDYTLLRRGEFCHMFFVLYQTKHTTNIHTILCRFVVKDCDPADATPCSNQYNDVSLEIFASPEECCGTHLGYQDLDDCVTNSLNRGRRKLLSEKWYYLFEHNGVQHECVRECDGPEAICAGKAADNKELFDSFHDCCEHHLYGKIDDCTAYDENGNVKMLRGRKLLKRQERMRLRGHEN